MKENRAFKAVSRYGGDTTMTDGVAQRRHVIICDFNRRETSRRGAYRSLPGERRYLES